MIASFDGIVSRDPLVVRRRVRWGDCDPAQVVYTPQFAHYSVDAIEAFFDEVIGKRPYAVSTGGSISFPMRALALQYLSFLVAGDQFDMTVQLGEVRRRTFDIDIEARCADRPVFRVKATPIATDMKQRVAVEIPEAIRASLAAYAGRARRGDVQ
jgi:acyl-CoA thioester hydrolase